MNRGDQVGSLRKHGSRRGDLRVQGRSVECPKGLRMSQRMARHFVPGRPQSPGQIAKTEGEEAVLQAVQPVKRGVDEKCFHLQVPKV